MYGRAKESRQGEGLEDVKHMYGRAKESRREEGLEDVKHLYDREESGEGVDIPA